MMKRTLLLTCDEEDIVCGAGLLVVGTGEGVVELQEYSYCHHQCMLRRAALKTLS